MSKVGEHYREKEEMGLVGGYEASPEERSAKKAIKKEKKSENR